MGLKFIPKESKLKFRLIKDLNSGEPFRFSNTPQNQLLIKLSRANYYFANTDKASEEEPYMYLTSGLFSTAPKNYEVIPVDVTVEEK